MFFTQLFEFKFRKSLLKIALGLIIYPHFSRSKNPFNSPKNGNVINWLISSRIPITSKFQYPVRSFVLFNFFVSSVCFCCFSLNLTKWLISNRIDVQTSTNLHLFDCSKSVGVEWSSTNFKNEPFQWLENSIDSSLDRRTTNDFCWLWRLIAEVWMQLLS